jgi:hypothetical protein
MAALLTVSGFADRTGQVVEGPMAPDESAGDARPGTDPGLEAAAAWLLGQSGCAGP